MKDVLSRGRTIDCFLSIATVLRGILRHDVKTPLLSDLFLAASCISWSDFRSHASTEIGPREHAVPDRQVSHTALRRRKWRVHRRVPMVHGREHAHAEDDECGWHEHAHPPVQMLELAHVLRFEQAERRQEAPGVKHPFGLCVELCVKVCSSSLPLKPGWRSCRRCCGGRGRDIPLRFLRYSRVNLKWFCTGARRATLFSARPRRSFGRRRWSRSSSHELSKLRGRNQV